MNRILLLVLLGLVLLLLALGAWTVQGLRWALTHRRGGRLATAAG